MIRRCGFYCWACWHTHHRNDHACGRCRCARRTYSPPPIARSA